MFEGILETLQTPGILAGVALIISTCFGGYSRVKRTNYEGQALLIRAERGDVEPAVIVQVKQPFVRWRSRTRAIWCRWS